VAARYFTILCGRFFVRRAKNRQQKDSGYRSAEGEKLFDATA
jgi:hypothetical protein